MADLWLKISCFFTGYNYQIVKNSSELASKMVKKNMSALIIISLIWNFIGYNFTARYLHGNALVSSIVAIILVIVVIQIERQILLTINKNKVGFIFRGIIGLVMAFLGSIIIDQVIFKDDIEKNQIDNVQLAVNNVLPLKSAELKEQIIQIARAIEEKESERAAILEELGRKPTIPTPTSVGKYEKDSTGRLVMVGREVTYQSLPNPKADLIPKIDEQIAQLRTDITRKEDQLLNMRNNIEEELKSKTGFLDEINALFKVVFSSYASIFVWGLLFFFFFALELFILINKLSDEHTDYEEIVMHQRETRRRQLEKLV